MKIFSKEFSCNQAEKLSHSLLQWYNKNCRELPWRITPKMRQQGFKPNIYHIWLSEIMLQQTTIATVMPYFKKFIDIWPRLEELAKADCQAIKTQWAGLGYYRRADNLHKCAQEIVKNHKGIFPRAAKTLKKLPGIGDYTSAAIAAIVYDESMAVIDGNVERIISRLVGLNAPPLKAKKNIQSFVQNIVPNKYPGDFAQGMMDLGATICTPKKPKCNQCPWQTFCYAYENKVQENFPIKKIKPIKPIRHGVAYIIERKSDQAILMQVREENTVLAGMVALPSSKWGKAQDDREFTLPFIKEWTNLGQVKHVFTHFTLMLEVRHAYWEESHNIESNEIFWVLPQDLKDHPIPTLMTKALKLQTKKQHALL